MKNKKKETNAMKRCAKKLTAGVWCYLHLLLPRLVVGSIIAVDGGGIMMIGRTLPTNGRLSGVRIIILILRGIWIPIGLR